MAFQEFYNLSKFKNDKDKQLEIYESLFKHLFKIKNLYLIHEAEGVRPNSVVFIAINKSIASSLAEEYKEFKTVTTIIRTRDILNVASDLEKQGVYKIRFYFKKKSWWTSHCNAIPYFYDKLAKN